MTLSGNGVRIGRPPIGVDQVKKRAANIRGQKKLRENTIDRIVIADFETDPFDNTSDMMIMPFLFCMYSPDIGYITLWRDPEVEPYIEDFDEEDKFLSRCLEAIKAIPGKRIIYAHNGGRFDWKLMFHLLKGKFQRKGNSLMRLYVGKHELRDSVHIYPGKLASYNKSETDYADMARDKREAHKPEITEYCKSDCKNLYDIVHWFVKEYGFKISIGAASISLLRKEYPNIKRLAEHGDGKIRGVDTNYYHKDTYGRETYTGYFLGGRTQCLDGRTRYDGIYTVFDVNSMYPYVMSKYLHPVGACFDSRTHGDIRDSTCFIRLRCRNHGALLSRALDQPGQPLTSEIERGIFYTTIHEYNVATKYNLLEDVEILEMIDCDEFTNFAKVIEPLYNERALIKAELEQLKQRGEEGSPRYLELVLRNEFIKLLLNNMYGKFAQNPRKYHTEYWVPEGEPCEDPEAIVHERYMTIGMVVWRRPKDVWNDDEGSYSLRGPKDRLRFNNVATGASITGAARSVLLEAICNSSDPIYCDTDSLIAHALGNSQQISQTVLGAWKKEYEVSNVMIAAKKLYGYIRADTGKWKSRSKGIPEPTRAEFERLVKGEKVQKVQKGVTIGFDRRQVYQMRTVEMNIAMGPCNLRKRIG